MRLDNLETTQKKTSKITEGLRPGDLEHLVSSMISVNEFEPKSGDDVVVVAFYVKDEEPAKDLASFIERGTHDILDTEVSPAPDENGNYLVFVEIDKNKDMMSVTKQILDDVQKLIKIDTWKFKFHGSDNIIELPMEATKWLKN